jgi:hypothetical protein
VLLLLATVTAQCGGETVDCRAFRFDASEWKRARSDPHGERALSTRRRFADGLVACGTLNGTTRDQSRRLLGRPSEIAKSVDGASFDSYYVGPERGSIGLDDELLELEFRRGEVVAIRLTT